ncbi:CehA/McbA family metallohydrolase [Myceligenerans pegani]|uniref:CehA/McbA family metallohydrolase n=1 Tax=Myceligenerans pegani TaxID=2776917 RepID=A0ABR9MVN7_9MICO|nr:CehA/McbA family metallohydrolase [Myceligenerans sp. TRM 65318]MBE1874928.1 CehA/McbA family metallohydrolase [Myceligenerans sp. TRM 65318]MBE3017199.1 CehA/McbA family metallohydrolase [Myceligenerans sp. TRM 65318]
MTRQVERLLLGIEEQIAHRYLEVPFDVSGAHAIEVRVSYDRHAASIEVGCRDPLRWRGWSGAARDGFVIRPTRATPGYEPGALPDGGWAVVLGLHSVTSDPIPVTVTVVTDDDAADVEPEPPAPPRPTNPRASERGLPAPAGLTWYAGDLHAHSTHSDGSLSLHELTAAAATRGLDFLAVTDHNTVSHHAHLPEAAARYDTCLLPGQEVTTDAGHANAFGDVGWIDFRAPAEQWSRQAAARGGLLSVNHPVQEDCAWLHDLSDDARARAALEIWHISWFLNPAASAPWAFLREWSRGREVPVLLGGSDFHTPEAGFPPGTPTTWVAAAERTPEAILEAVTAGRTSIARFPGPGEPVLLRAGGDLIAVDADGTVLVDAEGRRRLVRGERTVFRPGTGPHCLEAADRTLLAISP